MGVGKRYRGHYRGMHKDDEAPESQYPHVKVLVGISR